jgi:hypothetical protein
MDVLAFASFAALVIAWLAAPDHPRVPVSPAAVEEQAEAA